MLLRFRATKAMQLYCKLMDVLGFFMSTEWEWKTDNLVKLEKTLSPFDRNVPEIVIFIVHNSTTVGYVTPRSSNDVLAFPTECKT